VGGQGVLEIGPSVTEERKRQDGSSAVCRGSAMVVGHAAKSWREIGQAERGKLRATLAQFKPLVTTYSSCSGRSFRDHRESAH